MKTKWIVYNHALIPSCFPHEEPDLSNIKALLKNERKVLFARYTTDFDCGYETPFWCCIKDDVFDIQTLKAKRRYEVNKGIKNYYVQLLLPSDVSDMYDVYLESMKGYISPSIEEKAHFIQQWTKVFKDKRTLIFGVFQKETDLLCGYAHVLNNGRYVPISVFKTRVSKEKSGVNFALIYGICDYYRESLENNEIYLCDGYRNVLHETAFQDWLIKYFGFRRAYCNLHIVYKPFFGIAVKTLCLFKNAAIKLAPHSLKLYLKAIIDMEEWSKQCKKLKSANH